MKVRFEKFIQEKIWEYWDNHINYGKKEKLIDNEIQLTFNKLRDFIGETEARKWLFELDELNNKSTIERETAMYKRGFIDGLKFLNEIEIDLERC